MTKKILVTSALPYVNNVPHLGNIIGCVLSADVFSRYCKSRGYETLFIGGTDEHGTATETKALEEGLTPQQICDKYFKIHKDVYDWFGCSFDAFGRTSTDTHTEVTQSIFKKLNENGFIKSGILEQTYCSKCDKFLADRFAGGTCPHCGYEDARGDQCESCGKLLNAIELINPRCRLCDSKPQIRKSNHLFLDLPILGSDLEKWSKDSAKNGFWTQNSVTVTNAWFKEGLKKRCISRDLKWGIPIPLEGYTDKVFYVWFDAPIGYISITKHAFPEHWEEWWKADNVNLYQFMAKDNIPFHTIIFPATLIGSKDKWTMPYHIDSTEYLNYEGGKFSKSAGTGVFGDDAVGSGIPADVWRYYLIANRPEGSDSYFSWSEFQDKNNNELLANLGNFINRTLTFTKRYFNSQIPSAELNKDDDKLFNDVSSSMTRFIELMDKVQERDALKEVMRISRLGNQYFQDQAPWVLIKQGDDGLKRCGTVLNVCCNLVRTLAVIVESFLPFTSIDILKQLNLETNPDLGYKMYLDLEPGHTIDEPSVLFRKLEDKEIADLKSRFECKSKKESPDKKDVEKLDEFPLDLKVGKVLSVEDHPDAGKLYVLKIDLGSETRQVVAGLKAFIQRENILGKSVVVVCNLKPAKLRGVESNGMMLAADDGKKVVLLDAPESDPGDEVTVEGVPNKELFDQISIEEFSKLSFMVNDEGNIVCKNFKKKLKSPLEYIIAKGISTGAKVR